MFKSVCFQNGRLYHKHTAQLWKKYPKKLHEWLLRLTEMFDLTFQISKELSLVPCLLSNERPTEVREVLLTFHDYACVHTGVQTNIDCVQGSHRDWKTWKLNMVMEKSWSMKDCQEVMEFCDQKGDFTNFASEFYQIYVFFC